tara:strand:+ start:1925 stop:3097 length:1173 start_codon:yes stop_codon:yes gene_type:complete
MALLVPNIGELESLRYLLNATHQIPRNLALKLFTSNTTPAEGDVPSQTAYYEPYADGNTNGYGTASNTGYPTATDNRADQTYTNMYGILLNGNRWAISTAGDPIASGTGSGTSGEYTITVSGVTGTISVGNLVSGTGIGAGAKVSRVDGSTVVLTVANSGAVSGTINFTGGVTTATYPEQVFTFTAAAGNIYGYYLARANNMPLSIHGVLDAAAASAGSALTKGTNSDPCSGVVGNNFITLPNVASIMDDITVGQVVGNNNAVPAGTKIIGIDRLQRIIYLDNNLTDNIQTATDEEIQLTYSKVSATGHSLVVGDVIYIAQGTTGTSTAGTYTVFEVPDANTFHTTPALDGTGDLTLHSSIMFAERFTNGPYPIQNNGDQIKITLNVSLD